MNDLERAEISSATDVDAHMDMDDSDTKMYQNEDMDMDMDNNLATEEQVETVQAEEHKTNEVQVEMERQEEAKAEAILDEANLAVQEHRGTSEPVDITSDKLSNIEQQLSDSIVLSSATGPGAFKSKTMGNTDQNGCRDNVKDVVIFGDDLFKLLSKASSEKEGWMKSTKAMDTGKGCVIQVTTQQRNQNGSYSIAEALTYVNGVTIVEQKDENDKVIGRRLKGVR